MRPKVCFLGTVYNGQDYLAETIRTILNQTMKDIEVVYMDDGSTDSTPEILQHFKDTDKRFRSWILPRNRGISYAWNTGLLLVHAPIICICSADDVYVTERAELSYKALHSKPYDAFYGAFYRANAQLELHKGVLSNGEQANFKPAIPWKKGELFKANNQYIGHGFMALTTKMAKKVPYRENLRVGIDYPFLKDLETKGCRFTWTDQPLGIYRMRNKSVSVQRRIEVEESNNA